MDSIVEGVTMIPDVSIIIVNWNTKDLLAQCLQSVYDTVSDLAFEVIVVDNASTDGSPTMVRDHFPQARLIENRKNEGFARANNQAICASHGRYLLLLNSDTITQPGALEAMVHFADRHPEAGIVGCKLLNADGSLQPSWAQFPTFCSELMGHNFRRRRPMADGLAYEVDWVGGACLLARRKAIEMVELLDEDFFMYSEETDWCFRMVRNGWKVYYLPGAEVIHFGGGSSQRASDEMLMQLYQSKLRFFRKHYGALPALGLRLA
ncbi:MAG: glycosyltransferase family 2 protein, partial [Anaerolineae bacterium]|nr:glycosyltransferase family 2 protein [Anaerolineae bacterium]